MSLRNLLDALERGSEVDDLRDLSTDGRELIAGFFGHPAQEDLTSCDRPEDCLHPVCRVEAARIDRLGHEHLRLPDDSDLTTPEPF